MERITIRPKGVCSREMIVDYEDGVVVHCEVIGGCRGNLQGISRLVEGMKIEEVVKRLSGVECRGGTSCPDQLARGLKTLLQ